MSRSTGALKALEHRAALASTVRAEGTAPTDTSRSPFETVAEYARGRGEPPYKVIHDRTTHLPYGRYCVYVGDRRVGSQLSFPDLHDCRRMEIRPSSPPPLEARLSLEARRRLAAGAHNHAATRVKPPATPGRKRGRPRKVPVL